MRPLYFAMILAAACSSKSEDAPKAKPAPEPELSPQAKMQKAYDESFHGNASVPIPKRIELFMTKVPPPTKVEAGKRTWFARDAQGDCREVTLEDSGTMSSSKIFDQAKADASCPKK